MELRTRKEVILDAIAKKEVPNVEPSTREEVCLKNIAESVAGGGIIYLTMDFLHGCKLYHGYYEMEKEVTMDDIGGLIEAFRGGARIKVVSGSETASLGHYDAVMDVVCVGFAEDSDGWFGVIAHYNPYSGSYIYTHKFE